MWTSKEWWVIKSRLSHDVASGLAPEYRSPAMGVMGRNSSFYSGGLAASKQVRKPKRCDALSLLGHMLNDWSSTSLGYNDWFEEEVSVSNEIGS